jgi:hypothetical protein
MSAVAATAETFDEHILVLVDEFLQTVVVVDDRAFDEVPDDTAAADDGAGPKPGVGRGVTDTLVVPSGHDEHELDAKAVTDAFAEDGLVCSLLSPGPQEDVSEKFLRAAKRADLIVLDWVLHKNAGRKTLKLVEKVLAEDLKDRRRLRTIAVYTGQKELYKVAEQLASTIDAAYDDCELELHDDGLAMTKGPVRAAVFAKEHVSDLPAGLEERRVSFAELPERLRREFATLTTGLVTGVALAALAALRQDTHRILKTLGPKLDPAYLGNRAALPDPEEATAQAVALVAAEVRSVIEDNEVGRSVELPAVMLWLDDVKRKHLAFGKLINPAKPLSRTQVDVILTHGLGSNKGIDLAVAIKHSKTYFKDTVKREATKIFCESVEEAAESDTDFAHRTMMRTIYSQPARILQLGTIVESDGVYRLCVQPLCDSVRLTEIQTYPFLHLEAVEPHLKPDFIVANSAGDGWVHLRLAGNPSELVMISFDPKQKKAVTAGVTTGTHAFVDVDGVVHRWAGELKPDFSQRAAFDLAQQFARIAVDEAEIFRLARRG